MDFLKVTIINHKCNNSVHTIVKVPKIVKVVFTTKKSNQNAESEKKILKLKIKTIHVKDILLNAKLFLK